MNTHADYDKDAIMLYIGYHTQSGIIIPLLLSLKRIQVASLKDLFEQASVNAISIYMPPTYPYNGSVKGIARYKEFSTHS